MDIKSEINEKTLFVELSGKLSFKDHPSFNGFIDTIPLEIEHLKIDVKQLEQIDSSGIGMLFLAQKVMSEKSGLLTIVNPNGQVKRIFDIVNLADQINIEQN